MDHRESFVGFLTPPGTAPGDSPTMDALRRRGAAAANDRGRTRADGAGDVRGVVAGPLLRPSVRAGNAFATTAIWANPNRLADPNPSAIGGEEDEEVVVYVMDSLGERLCEGCKRGYVLRFDGSSSPGRAADGARGGGGAVHRRSATVAASAADRRGRRRVRVRGEGRERAVAGAAHAQAPDRVSQGAEGIVGPVV